MWRCGCTVGYLVSPHNSSSCLPAPQFLLYATANKLMGISAEVSPSNMLPPIYNIGFPTSIGFLASQQLIFWADMRLGNIWSMKRDGTERRLVLKELESPASLVVDWVAENLYWSDSKRKMIEVSRTDGQHRKIVVAEGLHQPAALEISAREGFLFYVDNGENSTRVYRSYLDGSKINLLHEVSGGHSITSLAVDDESGCLYYCDAQQGLIRLKYKEPLQHKHEVVLQSSDLLLKPFSLTFQPGEIWWSDSEYRGGSISYLSLQSGQMRTVRTELGGQVELKMFLSSVESESSPELPCSVRGGECEELCLYDGSQPTCHCSHRQLSEDGHTCTDHAAFVIFSRVSEIESLHINVGPRENPPFPVIDSEDIMRNAIGLAYSYEDKLIFYSDIQSGTINSVHFNSSSHQRLLTNLGSVEGIAFDAIEKFLFWTSTSDNAVKRVSVVTEGPRTVTEGGPELVVQLGGEDKPRGIDIDACSGMVYWTNWNRRHPAIQRAYYSGYNKSDLITHNIHMPNGLALDTSQRKLYWADARLDKIEVCNMDGTGCDVIVKSLAEHPFDLAVYDEFLFFTDWVLQAVVRINKISGLFTNRKIFSKLRQNLLPYFFSRCLIMASYFLQLRRFKHYYQTPSFCFPHSSVILQARTEN